MSQLQTSQITFDYTKQVNDVTDKLKSIQLDTRQFINNPENVNQIKEITEKNRDLYNNVLTSNQQQVATLRNQLAKIEYYLTITPSYVNSKNRETLELIQRAYILSQDIDNLIQKAYVSAIKPRFVGEEKMPTNYWSILVYIVLMIISLTITVIVGLYK